MMFVNKVYEYYNIDMKVRCVLERNVQFIFVNGYIYYDFVKIYIFKLMF